MRIIFAGTPEFAAAHLNALLQTTSLKNNQRATEHEHAHEIVAVYTQPDRRAGRGKKLLPSPVKQLAEQHSIPIEQPLSLKDPESQAQLASYKPDLIVVVAYGMLLPKAVLEIPALGCINVHASLLPRWRGAAPVERAILAGDKETGITIMQMDIGLDTGNMLLKKACNIDDNETGDSLRQKLIDLGKPMLLDALQLLADENTTPEVQQEGLATYAHKLDKVETLVQWQAPAIAICRKIRALSSALNCYAMLGDQRVRIVTANPLDNAQAKTTLKEPGEMLVIDKTSLLVRCGEGIVEISTVQVPGSKAMPVKALLNGKPDFFQSGMKFNCS